jgi:hypothetical protein
LSFRNGDESEDPDAHIKASRLTEILAEEESTWPLHTNRCATLSSMTQLWAVVWLSSSFNQRIFEIMENANSHA